MGELVWPRRAEHQLAEPAELEVLAHRQRLAKRHEHALDVFEGVLGPGAARRRERQPRRARQPVPRRLDLDRAAGAEADLAHALEVCGLAGDGHPVADGHAGGNGLLARTAEYVESLGRLRVAVVVGVLLLDEEAVKHTQHGEQRRDDRLDSDVSCERD